MVEMKSTKVISLLFVLVISGWGQDQSNLPFGPLISEQALTSFSVMGTGARALGMGGAFTAIADDATAASFNPAGLAQIIVPEVSFVGQFESLDDNYRNFISYDQEDPLGLTDSSIQSRTESFGFFSATFPFSKWNRPWSAQLSSQEIVNLDYRGNRALFENGLDGNPLFELEQDVSNSGQVRTYSGSISVQATPRTLLGLTLNHWDGKWGYSGFFSEFPFGSPDLTEHFVYHQQNRLNGWNFDAGLLLKYEHVNVGIRYQSPADLTYKLNADVQTQGIETSIQPISNIETELRWPSSVTVGLSWKVNDRFVLAGDWNQTDWSKMSFVVPGHGEKNFFDLQDVPDSRATSSDNFHVGVEYVVLGNWGIFPLRLGWASMPQPAPDTVTGERINSERYSAGFGIKRKWFAMDLAYTIDQSRTAISRFVEPDDIANGALSPNSVGVLDRNGDSLTLSFIIQFSKKSPGSRLLHRLFVGPE